MINCCPHCTTELTKGDTTCWQCGEAVDLEFNEEQEVEEINNAIGKVIFVIFVAVFASIATALINGDFI